MEPKNLLGLKSSKFFGSIDWVSDQDVVETRRHHDLGLANLGTRDSRGAGIDLKPGDLRHLVGLGVGPKANAGVATSLGHLSDIDFDAI
jgi:hypothetical protein